MCWNSQGGAGKESKRRGKKKKEGREREGEGKNCRAINGISAPSVSETIYIDVHISDYDWVAGHWPIFLSNFCFQLFGICHWFKKMGMCFKGDWIDASLVIGSLFFRAGQRLIF